MIKYNLIETCDLENLNPFILIFNICILSSDMNQYIYTKTEQVQQIAIKQS